LYRFEHTHFLWFLVIIPIIILIAIIHRVWRKKALANIGEKRLLEQLIPNYAPKMKSIKVGLFTLSCLFLILGLANLQFGSKLEEVKSKGVDIMIALDVSNSMLAEDITPNRLEFAKREIDQLVGKLHNDRLGVVVFAGDAMVQLPITTDYSAVKLFLKNINTNIIAKQGTAIGTALELASESFDYESPTNKAIIVITDGENHEDDALEFTKQISNQDVIVHTIGMGSQNGGPIPVYKRGKQIGYRKDKEGNTIISKLDEQMLKDIAQNGNGVYVRATSSNSGLPYVLQEIDSMEKTEFDSMVIRNYKSRFQMFLWIALALFIVREILPDSKKSNFDLFDTNQ
jgi:Ca-activated chloride channel family protein